MRCIEQKGGTSYEKFGPLTLRYEDWFVDGSPFPACRALVSIDCDYELYQLRLWLLQWRGCWRW